MTKIPARAIRSRKITNACSCDACKAMCHSPCWPTPAEARRLIDAGLGHRLRADYWVRREEDGGDILVLSPALKHRLGDVKPGWPTEDGLSCTFFVKGRCQLHNRDLKPVEGRVAHHGVPVNHRSEISKMWDTPKAQALARDWIERYGKKREYRGGGVGGLMSLFGQLRDELMKL